MQVEIENLGFAYPGMPSLFQNMNLTLKSGDMVAVVGPSGSGKSTLLSILAGWERPGEGVVRRRKISRVSWVFQNPLGVARRSALDHVVLPVLARGAKRVDAEVTARAYIEQLGLREVASQPFGSLSGGQAQRLMLARALAAEPDLLLVDEPTAQLDPQSISSVVEGLATLVGKHSIVVVATHDPRVASVASSRVRLGGS